MVKKADKYFKIDPWKIIEEGFDPEYSQVSESIFSLGNEYMGIRGYFEEGYSGERLVGSYFNGVYETQKVEGSSYKGIIDTTEFMVNSLDWLYFRAEVDGEKLDLYHSLFKDFYRELDLKTGVLKRSYVWVLKDGREIKMEYERFLSMTDAHVAGQKVSMTPLNFSGEIIVTAGLDFNTIHTVTGKNLWNCKDIKSDEKWCSILGETVNTKMSVFSYSYFESSAIEELDRIDEKRVEKQFAYYLSKGETSALTRVVFNIAGDKNLICNDNIKNLSYHHIKEESVAWWKDMWKASDIVIDGDELNQQGIRYCIFQMHQTYHGVEPGTIIGAKGLTGEVYSGNTFWDTEVYCLPFYLFNNLAAAKQLLEYRFDTLSEAKERAKDLDCEGAFYPIATISGRECCSLWQHASLQLQASTAVAYGLWHYENLTKDETFIFGKGLPILIEVSRMLATRGAWNIDRTQYGYYGVMGPDEFQMMVNHNCYTNYMGKITFDYTLDVIKRVKEKDEVIYKQILIDTGLKEEESILWLEMSEKMYIPYDEETMLYEQHDGYFSLPHIDISEIPISDFPLYHNWSYDRIYRNDMIKQPDVLMIMLMYNGLFTKKQLLKNYDYYEPRCIHESSLSPSVHSILASQLQKHEEAYKLFGFATRMDLDNYNRNTSEGLHTTSIAAAWMNIVYGFGGMRSDGKVLSFAPSIPSTWNGYSFQISYQESIIKIKVEKEKASFYIENDTKIKVKIYNKEVVLGKEKLIVDVPAEWRG